MSIDDKKPMTAQKPPRTRVVLIVDEETGEVDYFVMRDRAELIVLEAPVIAAGLVAEKRRLH